MTETIFISAVAFLASGLTLFSGFGLGTLLMPAFALFFPLDVAIALTAIVHLLNNFFKLVLLGRFADRSILLRFGLPAMLLAFLGAEVLVLLSDVSPIATYTVLGKTFMILPVKLVIAVLMIVFALIETVPRFAAWEFERQYLVVGGALSGFFGGLSGHQGALRSAFLARAGLSKEAFIGTGVAIACLVDLTRLSLYASHFTAVGLQQNAMLLIIVTASAFVGAFVGNRLLKKTTLRTVQRIVAVMLLVIAVGLGSGLI